MEAFRQHVHEKAANELFGRERHYLVASRAVDPIILVAEADGVGVGCDQAVIGDSDAVGVTRQISETVSGPPNGRLA